MRKTTLLATLLFVFFACQNVSGIPSKTNTQKKLLNHKKTARIKEMINNNTDPCTDFYEYACGGSHRNSDNFKALEKAFDRRIRETLQKESPADELELKLQSFFQACKLVDPDDVHYKLALKNVYKEFGDLPVLAGDAWKEQNLNWWELIANIQNKYGKQIILGLYIPPYPFRDVTIHIGQTKLMTSSKIISATDLIKYLGVEKELAKKTVSEITELNELLMNGGSGKYEWNWSIISELSEQHGEHINITKFLELAIGIKVNESKPLFDKKYLADTIATLEKTPKRTVANYILLQLLQEYLIDASEDMNDWCVEKTKKYFGKYIDHIVYATYKSTEAEAEINKIWEDIRSEFRDQLRIDKYDWMLKETRTSVIEKLDAMVLKINSYDDEDFEEIYADLTIDRSNYVHNMQQVLMLKQRQTLQQFKNVTSTPDEHIQWPFTPSYNLRENKIRMHIALLQPNHFWRAADPMAEKYATLGYFIAHAMLQGITFSGVNFAGDFKAQYMCFQGQYHNHKLSNIKIPEYIMQPENVYSSGAIKVAYAAYKSWLFFEHFSKPYTQLEDTFEELPLNNRQLFFTAFAQIWCGDVHVRFENFFREIKYHGPVKAQVLGPLSNFDEFAWAFNCKRGSGMHPELKCAIY